MAEKHGLRLPAIRAVILGASLAAAAPSALADNNILTATLSLTGNVNAFAQVFVENVTGNTGFDLTTTQSATQIATVRERSNRRAGYKVMLTSSNLNAGNCSSTTTACFHSTTSGESLAIDIFKGSSATALSLAANPVGNSGNWTNSLVKTTGLGISNAVRVAFDGAAASLGDANDYSETLTFTIAANP
jgi:hypothetical protein